MISGPSFLSSPGGFLLQDKNSATDNKAGNRMSERDLGLAVEQLCKYLGVRYYHAFNSQHSVPGWPDYVFIRKDFTLLIRELKSAKGKLTAHQTGWLDALNLGGHDADTWRPADLASGRILAELKGSRNLEGCS